LADLGLQQFPGRDFAGARILGYNGCFTTKWAGFNRPFFLVVCFLTIEFQGFFST
jgi:hypothetical protein